MQKQIAIKANEIYNKFEDVIDILNEEVFSEGVNCYDIDFIKSVKEELIFERDEDLEDVDNVEKLINEIDCLVEMMVKEKIDLIIP
jgi:hypothetical protein